MLNRITLLFLLAAGLIAGISAGLAAEPPAAPDTNDQSAIHEAAVWIGHKNQVETEYRYVMTCRVRFVFFWGGKDDVGGGYVRIGRATATSTSRWFKSCLVQTRPKLRSRSIAGERGRKFCAFRTRANLCPALSSAS